MSGAVVLFFNLLFAKAPATLALSDLQLSAKTACMVKSYEVLLGSIFFVDRGVDVLETRQFTVLRFRV